MVFMDSGVTKITLNGVPNFKVVSIFISGGRIKLIELLLKGPIEILQYAFDRGLKLLYPASPAREKI